MDTRYLEAALQKLVGLRLRFAGAGGNMRTLIFGPIADPDDDERNEISLHIQCAWRIVAAGKIITGLQDWYVLRTDLDPPSMPKFPNYQQAALGKLMDSPDGPVLENTTGGLIVESAGVDSLGGFSLRFVDGCTLTAFPDSSVGEHWRVFQRHKEHIVAEGEEFYLANPPDDWWNERKTPTEYIEWDLGEAPSKPVAETDSPLGRTLGCRLLRTSLEGYIRTFVFAEANTTTDRVHQLEVECPWHIRRGTMLVTGFQDRYKEVTDGEDATEAMNVQQARVGSLLHSASLSTTIENMTDGFTVESLQVDELGGFSMGLGDGFVLRAFPAGAKQEPWRFRMVKTAHEKGPSIETPGRSCSSD